MQIKKLLEESIYKLKEKKIEEPVLKSKILLTYVLDVPKEYLITHNTEEISREKQERYTKLYNRLLAREPIQYLIGRQEFMGLLFYVNENVLIPRADTELLVEEVLEQVRDRNCTILDLCTGSGAIGISIAKYLKNAIVTQSDISTKALEVAKENAKRNQVEEKITFIESDMFEKITDTFDYIVSNPPYIQKAVIEELEAEVKKEPLLALDGGKDGLQYYRIIIKEAVKHLTKNGTLIMEIGYDQKNEVETLLKESGNYEQIQTKQDLAGKDRMVIAKVR